MNKIKNIYIYAFITLLCVPFFVSAQTPTKLAEPKGAGADSALVTCGAGDDICDVNDINKLLMDILKLIFMFAGFIVAGMFMYAGFLLITAAGNTGQIQKAKDIFRRVVIGFLIMFLSYIVVKNLLQNIDALQFFKNLII